MWGIQKLYNRKPSIDATGRDVSSLQNLSEEHSSEVAKKEKPPWISSRLRPRVHHAPPTARITKLNDLGAQIYAPTTAISNYGLKIVYIGVNAVPQALSLPPTSTPGSTAPSGVLSLIGMGLSFVLTALDIKKWRVFSEKFSPTSQNKEDRKLETKNYRWGVAGYVLSALGNIFTGFGSGITAVVNVLKLAGVGVVATGGHILLRMGSAILGVIGAAITGGVEVGRFIYYAVVYNILRKQTKKIEGQTEERTKLIVSNRPAADLLKAFFELQKEGFTGDKGGKKDIKHLLWLSVPNMLGAGAGLAISILLILQMIALGPVTAGLSVIPLVFFIPWFVYSIKAIWRGHQERKAEQELQKDLQLGHEKAAMLSASIKDLILSKTENENKLKTLEPTSIKAACLRADLRQYEFLIKEYRKNYDLVVAQLKELEYQNCRTHPWLIAQLILECLFNLQEPAEAEWMKEALRKTFLGQPEAFDPWYQLVKNKWETNQPEERIRAMYEVLETLELPKDSYFHIRRDECILSVPDVISTCF